MNTPKRMKPVAAAVLSIGLCFGTTSVAQAEVHYPISGSSFDRGQYRGSWKATATYSMVSAYSFSNSNFCDAVQDGHHNYATVSRGVTCRVTNNETKDAHNDWVEFYMK